MNPLDDELERLEALHEALDTLITEYLEEFCHRGPLPKEPIMSIPKLTDWNIQRIQRLRYEIRTRAAEMETPNKVNTTAVDNKA